MNITVLSVIYFVAFSHALMIAIVLWQRSAPRNAGRMLAGVMLILAYKLFEGGATYSGFYRYIPHLLDLMPGMVLLLGPVFYGYVRKMSGLPSFTWGQWLLHFAPWLILWLLFNSANVFRSAELKIAMWDNVIASDSKYQANYPLPVVLLLIGIKLHLTTYLALATMRLQKFSRTLYNLRSDNSGEIIIQLKGLVIAFILLEALWVSLFIAQQYYSAITLGQVSQSWLLFISIIVLAMGFVGLKQPSIIFTKEEQQISNISEETSQNKQVGIQDNDGNQVKYIHSALPDSTASEIAKQIKTVLTSQQLYLNEKLALTDLAQVLEIKSHTISQVINQYMKTNFYKLVNGFRVQHAADLLEDTKLAWPIERIALESGFSNRVTFNKAFKEQMNCTASHYKKQFKQAG
ncbi:helix-turn-helix domain-containing protein [Thalassotalea sediminis]|uniref:helix-turn-helix domain-containing protein n=1 Tax=Thalassotalea sediminis TaxID=1759089 RepID=UPI002572C1EB|nr:helix-turn-helix domain-containing protein [Thalassotalea sediminis]